MVRTITTINSSNSFEISFASSSVSDDVIQANVWQNNRSYDEDAEFYEMMQLIANHFDEAFKKLAD